MNSLAPASTFADHDQIVSFEGFSSAAAMSSLLEESGVVLGEDAHPARVSDAAVRTAAVVTRARRRATLEGVNTVVPFGAGEGRVKL
jgi:hypothetical protein